MSNTDSTVNLIVEGMKCGGCSGRLQRALDATEGVHASQAEVASKRVTVRFDAARIDEQTIRARIAETGFTVVG
ncbi:MAG: heavy-metal-associated domain-containing protein [Rhodocyclaceae bacterium]